MVSADSMQVYRGMDIGTAKPTVEEMDGVPHHMLDVADPAEDFSVARYVDLAAPIVEDILARGKRPLIVGGTGLYIDNLLAGRSFPPFSGKIRQELTDRVRTEGLDKLYAELYGILAAYEPKEVRAVIELIDKGTPSRERDKGAER